MSLFSLLATRERTSPQRKHPRVPVKPMRREREVLIDFRDAYAAPKNVVDGVKKAMGR